MYALVCGLIAITAQTETAPQLVSRMIAHYFEANTLSGTITMTQRAGENRVSIQTRIQMEAPNKLFIHQVLAAKYGKGEWLVTSDGNSFSYDPPKGIEGRRLMEACRQNGVLFTHRNIYQAVVDSLGDRSTPLDLIIGRREDLEYRRLQWATLEKIGESKNGDVAVTVVGGKYRDYGKAPVSGTYEMSIDASGNLLRYVERESVAVRVNRQDVVQQVETVWDVSVTKNGPVDPNLFRVVR